MRLYSSSYSTIAAGVFGAALLGACSSPGEVTFGGGGEGGEWRWNPATSSASSGVGGGAGGSDVNPTGSGGSSSTGSSSTGSSSTGSSSSSSSTSSSSSSGSGGSGPGTCGPTELCGGVNRGRDNDCDGVVDEGCSCVPGQAQGCFKGDPARVNSPGCFEGTQVCGDDGQWGDCQGGVHFTNAAADMACKTGMVSSCHGITALPYVSASLSDGIGNFGDGATSETWMVSCPEGTAACPKPTAAGGFSPLVSGEYKVTYSRVVSGATAICQFPLIVGDRGLRIELEWERGVKSADLDLHLHQPSTTTPWSLVNGETQDCGWNNCKASSSSALPTWFGAGTPPMPTDWYLDPISTHNTCYFHPQHGGQWQAKGLGCHNPRLDSDSINCDSAITNPANSGFCLSENINVDFVPTNAWMRMGVHYYSSTGLSSNIHPVVKVYCDGELSARLGTSGYNQPVTFTPADGVPSSNNNRFWSVGDVRFTATEADGRRRCVVQPNYANAAQRTPYLMWANDTNTSFGPAYAPIP